MSNVPFFSLARQWATIKDSTTQAINEVLQAQYYVGGPVVQGFEEKLANYLGANHAVSCNSGTDALWLALKALDVQVGDIVLTTPFSFIASSSEIIAHGAKPVFVDVDPITRNLCPHKLADWLHENATMRDGTAVHTATGTPIAGIVVVNIFGQCAEHNKINDIAREWGLWTVEDAAQSVGTTMDGKQAGTFGTIGTFSFYPTKNLGAFGDAGAMVTGDPKLAERLLQLRNHGRSTQYAYQESGINSRMDALQAAVLSQKLDHLDSWNARRRDIAQKYQVALGQLPIITLPKEVTGTHTYHQYCVTVAGGMRDALKAHMTDAGIGTNIFYPESFTQISFLNKDEQLKNPCPVAEGLCQNILALPVWPELTDVEVAQVCDALQAFAATKRATNAHELTDNA